MAKSNMDQDILKVLITQDEIPSPHPGAGRPAV